MNIKSLELINFRNYNELNLSFDRGVNLILGKNAQGKTNLIEALYITSIGKSFRTKNDRELINFNKNNAFIKVIAEKNSFDIEIDVELEKKGSNSSIKRIKKNKKILSKTSELINNMLIVVFSPEDLKLIKDEPEKRRRFLDREMCQISPSYYENYLNYRRALKQRNNYLKDLNRDNLRDNKTNLDMLDIWDEQIANYGSNIINQRKVFIDKLDNISNKIHSGITENREKLRLKYEPNIDFLDDKEKQKDLFLNLLFEKRNKDIENKTTSIGPHRDDIAFFVNDIDMRNYGSQGQQRTCALSLKLAELSLIKEETGEEAILLLDDVMSELDTNRQEFLIKTLDENQLFITATEIDEKVIKNIEKKGKKTTIYSVDNGNVEIVREK